MTCLLIRARANMGDAERVPVLTCAQHEIAEWVFRSERHRDDPFNEVELDMVITDPQGRLLRVPAFWAGGDEWRVRFAPSEVGRYKLMTSCSDRADGRLHGRESMLTVDACVGENPLLRHGPLHMAKGGRHLAHADGLPFFWLADTWWLGLTSRLDWPDGFKCLVADRQAKGFTVVQLLAGLFCDMPAHDERGANEGGLAWEPGYARINPAFFDWADVRIDWLVAAGLVPCLFGSWSFHLLWMGAERMRQHWRYLIARYGAYPVVWCLAGGGTMPYYLAEDREGDQNALRRGWTEMARYVASVDPYHRPLAVHPSPRRSARFELEAGVPYDLPMHHIGDLVDQGLRENRVEGSPVNASPQQLVGEVCYPGMLTVERHELHRAMFWISMLSEACGFTYGVNGIWQFNTPGCPFGPSPTGRAWPNSLWDDARHLASSRQVGWGKAFLEHHGWWEFREYPEWVQIDGQPLDSCRPYVAGIPAQVRVIYFPQQLDTLVRLCALETDISYEARFVDPQDGSEFRLGLVDGSPTWCVPTLPSDQDWILVLERVRA
jgi:hypothetical protein